MTKMWSPWLQALKIMCHNLKFWTQAYGSKMMKHESDVGYTCYSWAKLIQITHWKTQNDWQSVCQMNMQLQLHIATLQYAVVKGTQIEGEQSHIRKIRRAGHMNGLTTLSPSETEWARVSPTHTSRARPFLKRCCTHILINISQVIF